MLDAQQVGNLWSKANYMLSLSLNGTMNFLDQRSGALPVRFVEVNIHYFVTSLHD